MRLPLALALVALAAPAAHGQRSLHWRAIEVDARLDSSGRLHVRERQHMVFNGDWNGGERRFDIRPRQDLGFRSMWREDSVGQRHEMRAGTLDVVDGYDFTSASTLRWRSRRPSDPPFQEAPMTYVLEYSIGGVLQKGDDTWFLDHDFAFRDRDGIIERVLVRLTLDDVWEPAQAVAGEWSAANLPPGEGFVVRVPLRFVGRSTAEPAVDTGAGPIERGILATVVVVLLVSFGRRLVAKERLTSRFDPLPLEGIDRAWLDQQVFSQLPEVIGAAWDNTTNAPEVGATLARLCADGRMSSRVEPARGIFGQPVLHLALHVPRDRFHGYERTLVDAFFDSGSTTTSTERVKERYRKSGFDPAGKIRKPLDKVVASLVPGPGQPKAPFAPTAFAVLGAAALLGTGIARERADAPVAIIGAIAAFACYLVSVIAAVTWRSRVHDVGRSASVFMVPQLLAAGGLLAVLITGATLAGTFTLAGLTLLVIAQANSVFNQARSRESLERIEYRRRLAAARAWFTNELRRPAPHLEDAWFPYFIALGLDKQMDRWFKAFGGAAGLAHHHVGSSTSSSGSGPSSGGWTGFGGGGGFSGGGTSASWSAAAAGLAAGVASPGSSSGGGGGGGGGGSSGGGGGGGW